VTKPRQLRRSKAIKPTPTVRGKDAKRMLAELEQVAPPDVMAKRVEHARWELARTTLPPGATSRALGPAGLLQAIVDDGARQVFEHHQADVLAYLVSLPVSTWRWDEYMHRRSIRLYLIAMACAGLLVALLGVVVGG
jgi:hypothetical protein